MPKCQNVKMPKSIIWKEGNVQYKSNLLLKIFCTNAKHDYYLQFTPYNKLKQSFIKRFKLDCLGNGT